MTIYTVNHFLKNLIAQISCFSPDTSTYEAEIILEHVLTCSRSDLYTTLCNATLDQLQIQQIENVVDRRKQHEPLPYILGSVSFYNCSIQVTKDVLIPRQETEILVETILNNESDSPMFFLDMGTGSGAIAAALLHKNPLWKSTCLDISLPALKIAKKNSIERSLFFCSDMFLALNPNKIAFDFIVSNPPYISLHEMNELDRSVAEFEPQNALYGGTDGLGFYRILANQGNNFLKPGGAIYCEIGYLQADSVMELFSAAGWKNIQIIKDLGNRNRVCTAVKSDR